MLHQRGLEKGHGMPSNEGYEKPPCPKTYSAPYKRFSLPPYQRASFQALLGLFLRGNGQPYLRHSHGKSASALSRFLNHYNYSSSSLIRLTRQAALNSLLAHYQQRRGRRPKLLVMIDLTTLEKTGRFEQLGLVSVLNKKRGLHVVVMYLSLESNQRQG